MQQPLTREQLQEEYLSPPLIAEDVEGDVEAIEFRSSYVQQRDAMLENLQIQKEKLKKRKLEIEREQMEEFTRLEKKKKQEEINTKKPAQDPKPNRIHVLRATAQRKSFQHSLYNELLRSGVNAKNLIVHQ